MWWYEDGTSTYIGSLLLRPWRQSTVFPISTAPRPSIRSSFPTVWNSRRHRAELRLAGDHLHLCPGAAKFGTVLMTGAGLSMLLPDEAAYTRVGANLEDAAVRRDGRLRVCVESSRASGSAKPSPIREAGSRRQRTRPHHRLPDRQIHHRRAERQRDVRVPHPRVAAGVHDGQFAKPRAEESADLVGQQREAEERREVARAEELADATSRSAGPSTATSARARNAKT